MSKKPKRNMLSHGGVVSDKKVMRSADKTSTRTKATVVKKPDVIVTRSRERSDSHLLNKSEASEWEMFIMSSRPLYLQRLHAQADRLFPEYAESYD
ncbi:MAG TPA: hypothetical protein VHU83_19510 [Bryobacteraceae bacterium]|nr:hypothetical protein [Bryobacteraceae bacterium]